MLSLSFSLFKKRLSYFLKKVISLFKKGFLNHRKSFSTSSKKVFSGKKIDQTKRKEMLFYTPHLKVLRIH